jgi:hypothetical protein
MKFILLAFFILMNQALQANEFSDAFVIDIQDYSVKVVSPIEKKEVTSVIIKNDTLNSIYLKIMGDGQDIVHTHLKNLKSFSHEINFKNYKKVEIIPLSPPGQSIELIFSSKSYEVPAKNE